MEKTALYLLDRLNAAGYEAYIVGGAPRNKTLGIPVQDYDIATNAKPDEIKEVFNGYGFVESGIKHGTVGVIADKVVYEITTYRIDGEYTAHRRPKSVDFVSSLKEDLSRRDFTINALAYGKDLKIIDYFGGLNDLKEGIIKAVGNPEKRFTEDALRILRALRFSAVYGFDIEKNTYLGMVKCKEYLQDVSKERIFTELNSALCGKYAARALYNCKEILFEVIPELQKTDGFLQYSLSHDYDVFNHTLRVLSSLRVRTPSVCWAALLHDIGKPDCLVFDADGAGHTPGHMQRSKEISEPILERLKFPKKLKERVLTLVADHDKSVSGTKYDLKKYISVHGKELTYDLYNLKVADNLAHSTYGTKRFAKRVKRFKDYLDEIKLNNEVTDFNDLAISGEDLKPLAIEGKAVGILKEKLFDMVLKGKLSNEKTVLYAAASRIVKSSKIKD